MIAATPACQLNDRVEELEREVQERANKAVVDAVHKEQLIYWLLRAWPSHPPGSWADGVRLCLLGLGYRVDGDRAKRMLELGEPQPRKLSEGEGEDMDSPVEKLSPPTYLLHEALVTIVSMIAGRPEGVEIDRYAGWASVVASNVLQGEPYPATPTPTNQELLVARTLEKRLAHHTGHKLDERRIAAIKAEAASVLAELTEINGPLPEFGIDVDPDDSSRIIITPRSRS